MFITKDDLNTSLYPEYTQAIARYSDTVILAKLATAESELDSYLSGRFLIRPELERIGPARNALLLSLAVDMAVYHLYANPESIPANRVKRYEQAIRMLELMAKGTISLPGVAAAPVTPVTIATGQVAFGSNPRRATW